MRKELASRKRRSEPFRVISRFVIYMLMLPVYYPLPFTIRPFELKLSTLFFHRYVKGASLLEGPLPLY
jgi:hypothetical protein